METASTESRPGATAPDDSSQQSAGPKQIQPRTANTPPTEGRVAEKVQIRLAIPGRLSSNLSNSAADVAAYSKRWTQEGAV